MLRSVLDAEDLVCAVTSSADADRSKPHPDIVSSALERIKAEPAQAIFVGDTVWDVQAGRRAGVPTAMNTASLSRVAACRSPEKRILFPRCRSSSSGRKRS